MKKLLIIFSVLFTSTLYAGDKLSTLDTTSLFGESSVETIVLNNQTMLNIEGKGLRDIMKLVRASLIKMVRQHEICYRLVSSLQRGGATFDWNQQMSMCMESF